MKYRITPGSIFFIFSVFWFVYYNYINYDAHEALGGGYILFFSIFIFLGDLLLQYLISNYKKVVLIELICLPVILILALISWKALRVITKVSFCPTVKKWSAANNVTFDRFPLLQRHPHKPRPVKITIYFYIIPEIKRTHIVRDQQLTGLR